VDDYELMYTGGYQKITQITQM